MKLKDVKPIINKYFANITPEEIIKMFEEMGVQFEDIDETNENQALNIGVVSGSLPKCCNCKWVCVDDTCGHKDSPLYKNEVSRKDTCMFHDR